MLASGSIEGRDHGKAVEIEQYWREYYQRFEKHCLHVADRRVRWARGTDMQAFEECIVQTLDGGDWDSQFTDAAETVAARVRTRAAEEKKFAEWVHQQEQKTGAPRELATQWKELEILIEREQERQRRSRQKTLFDVPLSSEALEKQADANLKNGA